MIVDDTINPEIKSSPNPRATAIVVGNAKYSSRIFANNAALKKKLKLFYMDVRSFAPNSQEHKEEDFTLDGFVNDIEAVRAQTGSERVILIGQSVHNFMVLEYARRFPERVNGVVLVGSSPKVNDKDLYESAREYFKTCADPTRQELYHQSVKDFEESGDFSIAARMRAKMHKIWYNYDDPRKDNLWDDVKVNAVGWPLVWNKIFTDYDISKTLAEIQCPIFLGLAQHDYINPTIFWDDYLTIPNDLTVSIFALSGHNPQFEEPKIFDRELIQWLKSKNM